ncbi:MAG TPA: CoA transferase, partial [Nocardioidaceae bacterium]|nr:CoA transferase [Nocardioidaceae bacterium]
KDRLLVVAAANDGLFRTLCECLGLPELAADPRFATNPDRVAHRDELSLLLGAVLRRRTADDWFTSLTDAGVPCGPINDVAQGMELAIALGLEPIVDVHGVAQVAHPVRLSRTPAGYRYPPPALGSDQEILRWIDEGLEDGEPS